MGLRSGARGRQELPYNFPSPNVNSSLRKRVIAWDTNLAHAFVGLLGDANVNKHGGKRSGMFQQG